MLERIPTGIPGFDEVLGGGIPRESLFLIAGPSGTGKTIMCVQLSYFNAQRGRRVVYASFDEGKRLVDYMRTFGWDLEALIKRGDMALLDLVTVKGVGVADYVNMILEKLKELKAEILVIDSLTTLILSLPELSEARMVIDLLRRLKPPGTTIIATANMVSGSKRIGVGVEEVVADGVVLLRRFIYRGEQRIRLMVLKLRGSSHSRRFHEVVITDKGVQVIPIA